MMNEEELDLIFKLKMDKEKKERKDKERKEKEREKNKKNQWDALPNTALLNIFCKSELKDRLKSIPLVCKSWKTVTDDPRCWSSMIPDSVSPEDAFIKKISYPYLESYEFVPQFDPYGKNRVYTYLDGVSLLFKEEEEEVVVPVGLNRLRTLIKKSGGGAAITTLYLSPFIPYHGPWCYYGSDEEYDVKTYDEVLPLIANCCPNLKHISLKVYPRTSMEAVLMLLNKCKKLELIELFYVGKDGFDDQGQAGLKLLKLLGCLPDLYGFHFRNFYCSMALSTIVTHLPRLKLLRLDGESLYDDHISIILLSCLELQYLYVTLDNRQEYYNQDIIDQAYAQIPEFFYQGWDSREYDYYNYVELDNYLHDCNFENHGSKEIDDASCIVNDDFRIDDYRDILKQRKEDQYVSLLKEKMNNKKKKSYQCHSSLIKKKKKYSTVKKNKKDQCVYADYVIQ